MLPEVFLRRMERQLGEEFPAFLASYERPPQVGVRVNTLKLTVAEFLQRSLKLWPQEEGVSSLEPVPWAPEGFVVPPGSRPGKHPYHAAGLFYIQDPSAMAAVELLDPRPGERVLDLSAAPGGKTTHIAARMNGEGLLVANDIHPRRVRELARNLERWGARNVAILNETPARLARHFGPYFDKVLVDAPCSGEGMFRKDPSARSEWTPKLVESCAVRQDGILSEAARLVRPGGILVYATCTFAPQENEGTIARFLAGQPEFELCPPPHVAAFSPGRADWLEGEHPHNFLSRAVRLWPHQAPGEGHFIAVMRRNGAPDRARGPGAQRVTPLGRQERALWDQFAAATLNWRPPQDRLSLQGSYLYLLPGDGPDLRGLRVIHWGWWLGALKKNRFQPSHSLAMALNPSDVRGRFPLSADDERTLAYLHGEVLPSPGPPGWVLVTVDGYPLGWGKRVHERLKSHSPKWLRWI